MRRDFLEYFACLLSCSSIKLIFFSVLKELIFVEELSDFELSGSEVDVQSLP